MNKDIVRQITIVIAVVATIVVNGLASALPINGQNTGEIADRFPVFFVPAGYVFSIWGLIYLGLIAYTIYQALPAQRDNPRLRSIGLPFIVSSVANITWILLWHYGFFPLALVAMLVILVSLILVYLRLDVGRSQVPAAERWMVHLPFSIYLGWITVATVANVTSLLNYLGWNGFGIGEEVWLVIMLVVALVVAALMALTRRDVAYLLVLAWAFAGIAVKHSGNQVVSVASWVATAVVLALVLYSIYGQLRGRPQSLSPA